MPENRLTPAEHAVIEQARAVARAYGDGATPTRRHLNKLAKAVAEEGRERADG